MINGSGEYRLSKPANTAEHMMNQAVDTATFYLKNAVAEIDAQFYKGYAQEHPELTAAFMRTCASDFATSQGPLRAQMDDQ